MAGNLSLVNKTRRMVCRAHPAYRAQPDALLLFPATEKTVAALISLILKVAGLMGSLLHIIYL